MIEAEMSSGVVKLTPDEVYRVNRQRIAKAYGRNPGDIDQWSMMDYYDALAVLDADHTLDEMRWRK